MATDSPTTAAERARYLLDHPEPRDGDHESPAETDHYETGDDWSPEPTDTHKLHNRPSNPIGVNLVRFEIEHRPQARAAAMRAKADTLEALPSTVLPLEDRRPYLTVLEETRRSMPRSVSASIPNHDDEHLRKTALLRWVTGCCIWHASWLASDTIHPCACASCTPTR